MLAPFVTACSLHYSGIQGGMVDTISHEVHEH